MTTDHDRYVAACNYPGVLDEAAVERHLRDYLQALGVKRDVVRLRRGRLRAVWRGRVRLLQEQAMTRPRGGVVPLPCPFCGKEPEPPQRGPWYGIICTNSRCAVRPRVWRRSARGVLRDWNTRAPGGRKEKR